MKLIYHQFDDPTHGITIDITDDALIRVTVYQGDVQTHHNLTANEAEDMMVAIDNNVGN